MEINFLLFIIYLLIIIIIIILKGVAMATPISASWGWPNHPHWPNGGGRATPKGFWGVSTTPFGPLRVIEPPSKAK
jgi:hypothetical protein